VLDQIHLHGGLNAVWSPALLSADPGKHTVGLLSPRSAAFMPAAAKAGTFQPPRPPPSPHSKDGEGLAEQGGPALFKPASIQEVVAGEKAAGAAAAAQPSQSTGAARSRGEWPGGRTGLKRR
jgi:hypothetical protein